jgi:hypothetical protein
MARKTISLERHHARRIGRRVEEPEAPELEELIAPLGIAVNISSSQYS